MNRSRYSIIAVISFIVSVFLAQNIFAQEKGVNVFWMHYYQKGSADKKTGGAVSERKKKIKGGEKFDEPNMFAQFQNEIRTRAGKSAPEYPSNYLMEELTKSRARSRLSKSADLNWIERGPGNVSGRTRGIIVDQSDATHRTWFAGSVGGGIWKTTDAGASWVNKTGSLPNLATTVLVQAQSDPGIIYCGTGEGFNNIDAVNGAGIFKSVDRGESWTQLASTANFEFRNINRIIVHPTNPSIVLACTNQSTVQRSTDGGTTWNLGIFSDKATSGRIQDLKADPLNFSIQYCTVNNEGVFKSTDGGLHWSKTGDGLITSGRIEIAVSSKNPNYIYASAQTTSGSALYLSEDKGGSWLQINSSNGVTQNWLGSQGWYDNTIAVHPFDEKIVFFGGIDIWKAVISPDGGTSTTRNADFLHVTDGYGQYSKPYVHVDHHNLIMVPISSTSGTFWIVNGNDGGVAYSPDGGLHWFGNSVNNTAGNGGYNTTQFYGADKKPGFNEYIGGMQDNGTWFSPRGEIASESSLYSPAIGGDGFDVSWHYKDPDKIIGGSQYNYFRRTTDGGLNWSGAINGLEDVGSGKGVFISRIAKSNSDPDIIYTTGSQGVWRSEDFGASWSRSNITQSGGWSYSGTSTPIAVSIANPRVVWAGNYFTNSSSRLFVSRDGGITFDSVYAPSAGVVAAGSITGIDTHPEEMNTAYITYSVYGAPKILRTTDLGISWQDISGFGFSSTSGNGFPNAATYCILAFPNSDLIWAGTEIGLFESTDNGASWNLANNGLPPVSIWDMKIVDDQVVVATHGRGIWSIVHPNLAGYTPPSVTLSPIISALSQGVDNAINIAANLRSAYDSTLVYIDGTEKIKLASTLPEEKVLKFTPAAFGKVTVQLVSYKSGVSYKSSLRTLDLYNLKPARVIYSNNFDGSADDFTGNDFTISTPSGFVSPAVHSPHPYSEAKDYYYNLLVPIIITSSPNLANIEYSDIAIIEPGEDHSVFGDENFWDYVVVEGSKDGLTWIPFEEGYDCNFNPEWRSRYNTQTDPTSLNYLRHKIDMTKKFAVGETVLIRFHLYSDEAAVGWGWAIDSLSIQPGASGVEEGTSIPSNYALFQNYPNPFNPETTIKFSLPQRGRVKLEIFDALGRVVSSLVDSELDAGNYNYSWSGKNFASGVYFYRLTANDFLSTKKLMLIK